MAKRQRQKLWGDGRIYRKTRIKADGTRYEEPIWWLQYSVDGQVRRESSGTADAVKAQRLLDKRVHAIRAGEPIQPTRNVRLADLRDRYLKHYQDKKRRSTATAIGRWKHIADFFDMDRKALGVTTDEMLDYARARSKDGAEDSTINRELIAFKRGYSLARKAGVLLSMPSFPEARKEPQPRQNFITPEQHQALRAYLETVEPAYADALDFAMMAGWRKQQILGLTWDNILADEIRVGGDQTKGEEPHVIPLVPALREIIERRQKARVVGSPWVLHRKGGQRIGDFEKVWAAATIAAKCPGTWFHDTRRSAIRNLIHNGIAEQTAMKISGHRTNSTFKRYAIVTQDDVRKALETVSAPAPAKVTPKKHHRRVVSIGGRRK